MRGKNLKLGFPGHEHSLDVGLTHAALRRAPKLLPNLLKRRKARGFDFIEEDAHTQAHVDRLWVHYQRLRVQAPKPQRFTR